MKRVFERKAWSVDISEDGRAPVCEGPQGIRIQDDGTSVWIDHDVSDCGSTWLESVEIPRDFLIASLRAHGWTVEPPAG